MTVKLYDREDGTASTTGTGTSIILTRTVGTNRVVQITSRIVGQSNNSTECMTLIVSTGVKRYAGSPSFINAVNTTIVLQEIEGSFSGPAAFYSISGNDVRLTVSGPSGANVDWFAYTRIVEYQV